MFHGLFFAFVVRRQMRHVGFPVKFGLHRCDQIPLPSDFEVFGRLGVHGLLHPDEIIFVILCGCRARPVFVAFGVSDLRGFAWDVGEVLILIIKRQLSICTNTGYAAVKAK